MVITLHGKDTFRSLLELTSIENKYEKTHQGVNFFKFDCGARVPSLHELQSACGTQSLFAEPTLVVIKELFAETSYEDVFLKFLKHTAITETKDIVVVLWERSALKAPLLKKLDALGKTYDFAPLEGAKLRAWAEKEVQTGGGTIAPDALSMLVERCEDSGRMAQEIKKLLAYNPRVTSVTVEMLVPAIFEGDVFKMLDALAEGSRAQAFKRFQVLLRAGEPELKLLAMLVFQVRNMLKIKTMPPGSRDPSIHPFVLKKLSRVVGRFSEEKLKNIYAMLHSVDRSIKTGTPSPKMLLTRALLAF